MRKLALPLLASAATASTFGITILNEGFEVPSDLVVPGYYRFVSGNDIPGWTVINDNRGERPYLMHDARYTNIGLEFFDNQALQLNEGTGIRTVVPLVEGSTYVFSIWGYGDWNLPLEITVGSFVTGINFGHWSQGGLQERTFTFTAQESDDDAILQILNPSFGIDFRQRAIDNISLTMIETSPSRLTSNVPDGGGTLSLLGLGLFGLAYLKRSRGA